MIIGVGSQFSYLLFAFVGTIIEGPSDDAFPASTTGEHAALNKRTARGKHQVIGNGFILFYTPDEQHGPVALIHCTEPGTLDTRLILRCCFQLKVHDVSMSVTDRSSKITLE